MLFDKDTPKLCAYCLYGRDYDEERILCEKRGPMPCDGHCSKYHYDPIRRKPAAGAKMKKVKNPDAFEL